MELINGDCLLELKKLKDKSIDFVYLDLPYGQTACAWDKKLDHIALWEELKRIAKNERTPFFFSCTTKFGFELYNTAPKGWFRWDLVWQKNRAAGFLNAYRLPMRAHEMIYCFAKKSPEYDVSSHSEYTEDKRDTFKGGKQYGCKEEKRTLKRHKNPLPTSILPPQEDHELVYCFAKKTPEYDVSSHKEFVDGKNCKGGRKSDDIYNLKNNDTGKRYKDPLPTSILPPQDDHELVYCFAKKSPEYDVSSHLTGEEKDKKNDCKWLNETGGKRNSFNKLIVKGKVVKDPLPTSILPPQEDHELVYCFAKKSPDYDVSSHLTGEEVVKPPCKDCIYTMETSTGGKNCFYKPFKSKVSNEPLPTSVLPPQEDHELVYCFAMKSPEYDVSSHSKSKSGGDLIGEIDNSKMIENRKKPTFRTNTKHTDPLPTSVLDIPSSWCKYKLDEGINHRTSKPVKLMEFLLKYWSKEGDTILDPTAGSGSMGCACINMNRKFIGIEKDPDIFAIMKDRLDKHKKGEKVIIKPKKKPKKKI